MPDNEERTETADSNNSKTLFKISTDKLTVTKKKSMPVYSQPMLTGGTLELFKDKAILIAQQSLKITKLLQMNNTDFLKINEELQKDKIYPTCKVIDNE